MTVKLCCSGFNVGTSKSPRDRCGGSWGRMGEVGGSAACVGARARRQRTIGQTKRRWERHARKRQRTRAVFAPEDALSAGARGRLHRDDGGETRALRSDAVGLTFYLFLADQWSRSAGDLTMPSYRCPSRSRRFFVHVCDTMQPC